MLATLLDPPAFFLLDLGVDCFRKLSKAGESSDLALRGATRRREEGRGVSELLERSIPLDSPTVLLLLRGVLSTEDWLPCRGGLRDTPLVSLCVELEILRPSLPALLRAADLGVFGVILGDSVARGAS